MAFSMIFLSMEVNVESMLMIFIMLGFDHVGLDFLFQKLQQKL